MNNEKKIDDGGSAFPLSASTGDPRDGVYCQNGMTLRDWFASQEDLYDLDSENAAGLTIATAKLLAGGNAPTDSIGYMKWEAKWRAALKYIRADAMIAERAKNIS